MLNVSTNLADDPKTTWPASSNLDQSNQALD